jgi:ChrB-like protein
MSPMVDVGRWVLLAYRVPREPSAPRLAVWRKLKRLGIAQLLDGLVALPLDSRNREQLEWVADEVADHGGEATVWIAQPATAREERELAERMRERIAGEYLAVIAEAEAAAAEGAGRHRRTLARLRRELGRIARRDYFPPPERERAREAVDALARALEVEARP